MLKNEFEIFKVIYEEKSLSKAADRLDNYQGALSKILLKLEKDLSSHLFIRTNRGILPTDEGHRLYQQIIQQKTLWSNFLLHTQNNENNISGLIRVGGHPSVLQQFTESFRKIFFKFPNLELTFQLNRSPAITRMVVNHELDIGLVANPVKQDELVIRTVKKEKICLFSKQKIPKPFIIYNPDLISANSILKKIPNKSYRIIAINNYELGAEMAKSLNGSAILPESIASKEGLLHIQSKPFFTGQLCLIYRADHKLNKNILDTGFKYLSLND